MDLIGKFLRLLLTIFGWECARRCHVGACIDILAVGYGRAIKDSRVRVRKWGVYI